MYHLLDANGGTGGPGRQSISRGERVETRILPALDPLLIGSQILGALFGDGHFGRWNRCGVWIA